MRIHVVRKGETLQRIAQNYMAGLSQIILVNGLTEPDVLAVGEALVIPEPMKEYVVEAGDTLAGIAVKHGVTVNELTAVNQIANGANVYVGEFLIIPYYPYVIKPGDNLWQIANRFGITLGQLLEANGLSENTVLQPGQIVRIPYRNRPVKDILGYITNMGERGRATVLQLGNSLTHIMPFSYSFKEDGSLTELEDEAILRAARAQNAAPLLVVTNFIKRDFSSELAAALLRNPEVQETFITNLLATIRQKGYRGVNFDLEYIYPEDKENYNNFLRRVVARLRPEGYLVSTALAPKIRANQQGLLYTAHDYKAHGEIVDFVILMTYEWGWSGGPPLAVSPVNNIRQVIEYAITEIPRDKIHIGVSLYGYDWKVPWQEGTFARAVSPPAAVRLAKRHQVEIQYNKTYEAPFFHYTEQGGQRHEVWFEDARSIQAKYDLVKQYGLQGVAYWELSFTFPQNIPVMKTNFQTRKV